MSRLLLAIFAALGASAAHAATVSQECRTGIVALTASDDSPITNSASFVDVTSGTVTFTQRRTGCIVVDFTAGGRNFTGTTPLYLQALLDGVALLPGEIEFTHETLPQSLATSWTGIVGAGPHTVQIQFRSGTDGAGVQVIKPVTKVAHK